jgi:DNA-binding response OmpR family regulator
MLAPRSATPLPQHVLVVDDQPDICTVVQTGLEILGHYRVTTTSSCDNALPLLDFDRPDLVLLDVVLPGMTGLELAVRAVSRNIPVLLMTGERETQARLERSEWPHLRKPFRLNELIAQARAAMAEARNNTLVIRASLERLFQTAGDLQEAIERMADLRRRLNDTLERSRRFRVDC